MASSSKPKQEFSERDTNRTKRTIPAILARRHSHQMQQPKQQVQQMKRCNSISESFHQQRYASSSPATAAAGASVKVEGKGDNRQRQTDGNESETVQDFGQETRLQVQVLHQKAHPKPERRSILIPPLPIPEDKRNEHRIRKRGFSDEVGFDGHRRRHHHRHPHQARREREYDNYFNGINPGDYPSDSD